MTGPTKTRRWGWPLLVHLALTAFVGWHLKSEPWPMLLLYCVATAALIFGERIAELVLSASGFTMKLRRVEQRVSAYVDATLKPLVRLNYSQLATSGGRGRTGERVRALKELDRNAKDLGLDDDPGIRRDRLLFKEAVFLEILRYADAAAPELISHLAAASGGIVARGETPTLEQITALNRADKIETTELMQYRIDLALRYLETQDFPSEVDAYFLPC